MLFLLLANRDKTGQELDGDQDANRCDFKRHTRYYTANPFILPKIIPSLLSQEPRGPEV